MSKGSSWVFSSSDNLDNARALHYRLRLESVANVEYCLALESTLSITQEIRGPVYEAVSNSLTLNQTVTPQHAVPYDAESLLSFTQTLVHAGSFGAGGGELPQEAVADSDTQIGLALYVSSATNVDLASNTSNPFVIGLAVSAVTAGQTVQYKTEGSVEQDDWTLVTGTTLLTPGAVYYLDSSGGQLTSTPTTTDGTYVVAVARAASDKKLDIETAEPILL